MILSVCPNPSIDCYAWTEQINLGEVNRINKLKEYPGGKGVHVALAVGELGGKSRIFAGWAGGTGEWIKNSCKEKNIEVSGVNLRGNSRKCYTFRSSSPEIADTEILEPGPKLSPEDWKAFKEAFRNEVVNSNLVCFSGSWPKGAPKNAYSTLIRIATEEKKKAFLDCTGEQLQEALKSSFFGLHLNQSEAHNFCGSENFEDLLKKLKGRVELVAITRGKDGLWMSYKGRIYVANVKIDKVNSAVGSGDCLTAGIIWAFEEGLKPEEIAAYGVACGAANCLNEDLGMLKKEDVEELIHKVECFTVKNEL